MFRLQTGRDDESRLFQMMAAGKHHDGTGGTRQGIYAFTPRGVRLGGLNSNDPQRVAAMLESALAAWEQMPVAERTLSADERRERPSRPVRYESSAPEDGLILEVIVRDLPRPAEGSSRWNIDHAWFTRHEARGFLPGSALPSVTAGMTYEVPRDLVDRLVRFHLVDHVRGQTQPFEPDDIESARLTARVEAIDRDSIEISFAGNSRAVGTRLWRNYGDSGERPEGNWAMSLDLLGSATFDRRLGSFRDFEIVALGERSGRTRNNGRGQMIEPSPVGAVVRLSTSTPAGRIAPGFFEFYGWKNAALGQSAPFERPEQQAQ